MANLKAEAQKRITPKSRGSMLDKLNERKGAMRGEQPDWTRIDGEWIRTVIGVLCQDDGAVRFGYSRDGGAYAVCIYSQGDHETVYFHTDEELMDLFKSIVELRDV